MAAVERSGVGAVNARLDRLCADNDVDGIRKYFAQLCPALTAPDIEKYLTRLGEVGLIEEAQNVRLN